MSDVAYIGLLLAGSLGYLALIDRVIGRGRRRQKVAALPARPGRRGADAADGPDPARRTAVAEDGAGGDGPHT